MILKIVKKYFILIKIELSKLPKVTINLKLILATL